MQRTFWLLAMLMAAFWLGCPADDDDDDDATGDDDSAADDDDDTTGDPMCPETGLPPRTFVEADEDTALYATAADFTVPTTEGDWTLSVNFSGCDHYLFIADDPEQTEGWPTDLWDRDVDTLLQRSPQNVHYFFSSDSWNGSTREERLAALEQTIEATLDGMDGDEAASWEGRIHYVTEASELIEGWLGDVMGQPGWGVGIDSQQRIRYIGSYADQNRYYADYGWFEPNLSMAANEARYYNFEWLRQAEMDAVDATVVPIFGGDVLSDPGWAGEKGYADVELPDAATMASFDTAELDLYLGCDGNGEYGTCPAWDYIVHLYLCDEDDPESCGTEFGRWITTYHREGRWVHDVSSLLPLINGGGTRRFAFYTQQPYEVKLDLRLSNQGKEATPSEATYLFSGGGFGQEYNDGYEPITVAIPDDATRVEVATVITGHGMESPGNCAEFCVTTHHFTVDGTENIRELSDAGSDTGCMDQVMEGTVPNQYGTWWYGRSGWCPGKEVQVTNLDVTDQVTPGSDATIEYAGFYNGQPYSHSGPSIVMTSWLVVSR